MGTRADFYVGIGPSAEWIGSISYDGYPDGQPEPIFEATDEESFRRIVAEVLPRTMHTLPAEGWPWPWEDSRTTDWAYAWTPDGVRMSAFGHQWGTRERCLRESKLLDDEVVNMASQAADTQTMLAKSGLLILAPRRP